MSEPFAVHLTKGAETDLSSLTRYAQRLVIEGLEVHLRWLPTQSSRRIKAMRPNPVAGWELRLGDYRVLYDVNERQQTVTVQVIGEKIGNRLLVRGQEYKAHESD